MIKEFNEVPSDYVPGQGQLHAIIHTNMGQGATTARDFSR